MLCNIFNIWRVNKALVSPVGVRLIYNLLVENCYEENSLLQVLSVLFPFILRVPLSCFCPMTVCHNFIFFLYLQVLILPNALFFPQCITVINTSTSWLAINLIWIIQIILSNLFQWFWIGKCSYWGDGRNIFWFKKKIINAEVPDCISNESSNLDLNAEQCCNVSFKIIVFEFWKVGMAIYKRV